MRKFECGHVVAEALGGQSTIENLRPICKDCNLSMGTKNLFEFKEKHFPKKEEILISFEDVVSVKKEENKIFPPVQSFAKLDKDISLLMTKIFEPDTLKILTVPLLKVLGHVFRSIYTSSWKKDDIINDLESAINKEGQVWEEFLYYLSEEALSHICRCLFDDVKGSKEEMIDELCQMYPVIYERNEFFFDNLENLLKKSVLSFDSLTSDQLRMLCDYKRLSVKGRYKDLYKRLKDNMSNITIVRDGKKIICTFEDATDDEMEMIITKMKSIL